MSLCLGFTVLGLVNAFAGFLVIYCLFWVGLKCLIFVACGFGEVLLCLTVVLFWFI